MYLLFETILDDSINIVFVFDCVIAGWILIEDDARPEV